MTKAEAFKVIVSQIDGAGERLQELVEDQLDENEELNTALFNLQIVVSELYEQKIKE